MAEGEPIIKTASKKNHNRVISSTLNIAIHEEKPKFKDEEKNEQSPKAVRKATVKTEAKEEGSAKKKKEEKPMGSN
jgi:hypothetical protein